MHERRIHRRAAIARIAVREGGRDVSRGTGFVVGDGLVLTALHVVADRTTDPPALWPGAIHLGFAGRRDEVVATLVPEAYDAVADWVLLRCEVPADVPALPLHALTESEVASTATRWWSYGFPDSNPDDGKACAGEVRTVEGAVGRARALQLFSQEAAAGRGEPVRGYSGSPVLVDGTVVGLVRYALFSPDDESGRTEAGTLYACPIEEVLSRCEALLPGASWGVPGVPPGPLPAVPYRHLSWYGREHAEVFFGRDREIRRAYHQITDADAPPLLLIYGQAGVGKSSFLAAGLTPRLESTHAISYARRGKQGLAASFAALPGRGERPRIVIVDQLEEAYARGGADAEVSELLVALASWIREASVEERVVLSFRKEWLAEIERAVTSHGLPFELFFLEPMGQGAVREVVEGVSSRPRLQRQYRISVEEGLAETIGFDLGGDVDSPLAPTLQLLLTRMWDAVASSPRERLFSLASYRREVDAGLYLGEFLDERMRRLEQADGELGEAARAGLGIDLLAFHTTDLTTAAQRSREALVAAYGTRASVDLVVDALREAYLLVDAAADDLEKASDTRLVHDTLAPLVRAAQRASDRPGQRARRILEARRSDELLDDVDLATVRAGAGGMRLLTERERDLVARSAEASEARRLTVEKQAAELGAARASAARRLRLGLAAVSIVALIALALAVAANEQRKVAVAAEGSAAEAAQRAEEERAKAQSANDSAEESARQARAQYVLSRADDITDPALLSHVFAGMVSFPDPPGASYSMLRLISRIDLLVPLPVAVSELVPLRDIPRASWERAISGLEHQPETWGGIAVRAEGSELVVEVDSVEHARLDFDGEIISMSPALGGGQMVSWGDFEHHLAVATDEVLSLVRIHGVRYPGEADPDAYWYDELTAEVTRQAGFPGSRVWLDRGARFLLALSSDESVSIFGAQGLDYLGSVGGNGDAATGASLAADGMTFAVYLESGRQIVYRLAGPVAQTALLLGDGFGGAVDVRDVALHPSAGRAAVAADVGVRILDFGDSLVAQERARLEEPATSVAFSPDGAELLVVREGRVWRYRVDEATGAMESLGPPLPAEGVTAARYLGDGVVTRTAGSIDLWPAGGCVEGADACPQQLYVFSDEPLPESDVVPTLRVAPNGDTLVASEAFGGAVAIRPDPDWSHPTSSFVQCPHFYGSSDIAVDAYGSQIAVSSAQEDGICVLPELRPGEPDYDHVSFFELSGGVTSIDYSPDGAYLVSGGADGSVRLWRFGSREGTLLGQVGASIAATRFSADGNYLVAMGRDGIGAVWHLGWHEVVRNLSGRSEGCLPVGLRAELFGEPLEIARAWVAGCQARAAVGSAPTR